MAFGSLDSGDQEVMSEINMTPLVDVMLVLLIIFIVTVPVMKHAVDFNLPQATSKAQQDNPDTIRLSIDGSGRYNLDKRVLTAVELELELRRLAGQQNQPSLHIYGDKKVAYEYVASAMAMANRAGLQKVGFVTEPGK
jgi:biopolymer transport protein ExbD